MFKKKTEVVVHKCIVRLFEDFNAVEYEFLDTHKGSYLMDRLCQRLEIKEKDYFGLRFVDNTKQRQWLDLGKLIIKQCKDIHHLIFSFRVKFYPADPFHLSLNVRVLLYKQLKRDLNHGRIYCSSNEIVTLGALIVQEQFSDYDENIHTGDYLANLRLSARQTDAIEKKIIKKHRERTPGQDPIIVIDEFLRITRNLETYGTEPHYVKDHQGVQMYIGINFSGISAFISGKRTQHFLWNEIRKLNFEGKMFIAHIGYMDTSREVKKYTIGFKCASGAACRYLWRCAIEHMLFFTFIGRRGIPTKIFSDNATNFVGADRKLSELKEAFLAMGPELKRFAADEGCSFIFIAPRAPHFGGLWEAAVKSAKHHIVRVTGSALLTAEELATVLAEVEAILN
ncbi:FERM domain-containing protein 3 isoform X5 [Bactrocera dorsalis]|uniref:FERM domain-containing protein 3 isoform X5 n=1 Tax=Bactrocera dorsalis TaxID=27457 RepID=A0ABM3KAQ1_BACDO|nr:FERM domain-containing protein 3 isoform X5 [Bactrocera dorsalis]